MLRRFMLVGSVLAAASLLIAEVGCSHGAADAGSLASDVTGATPVLPVISAVYAGDEAASPAFVEIFNPSATPIGVAAYVLQWASGDADFPASNVLPLPTDGLDGGKLAPGQHLHVKLPAGAVTPASGKVAIASKDAPATGCVASPPTGAPCARTSTTDYFGWGAATYVPEPGAPLPALTKDNAAVRLGAGCQNLGDNAKDFALGPRAEHTFEDAATACPDPTVDAGKKTPFFLLNEIKLRQGASGAAGFTEIACAKDALLANVSYVSVDDKGAVVNVVELGPYACGTGPAAKASGIVLITDEGGPQPETSDATVIRLAPLPSATTASSFFIVYTPPGKVPVRGTNYDVDVDGGKVTNPDGTGKLTWPLDLPTFDSVAVAPDANTKRYASPLVHASVDALSRPFYGPGTAPVPNSAAQWFGGALVAGDDALFYDAAKSTRNIPQDLFALTPGASNLPPEADAGTDSGKKTTTDEDASEPDAGASTNAAEPPTKPKSNPGAAPIAGSAASVCSMTYGPRSPGLGVLAAFGAALVLAAARRKKR